MGEINKYELKNIDIISVYTDRKIAEEDLKKYEENTCDDISYCL